MNGVPTLQMSHFEIQVHDLAPMLAFYTDTLGFVITDRGDGPDGMVFLSRSEHEHHQVVLTPTRDDNGDSRRLDHIAFRVASIGDLRAFHARLAGTEVDTVTHGTTWSLYFHDPEGNRLEIFTDTPWYVEQPTRLPIELDVDDQQLLESSRRILEPLSGFSSYRAWHTRHQANLKRPRPLS